METLNMTINLPEKSLKSKRLKFPKIPLIYFYHIVEKARVMQYHVKFSHSRAHVMI